MSQRRTKLQQNVVTNGLVPAAQLIRKATGKSVVLNMERSKSKRYARALYDLVVQEKETGNRTVAIHALTATEFDLFMKGAQFALGMVNGQTNKFEVTKKQVSKAKAKPAPKAVETPAEQPAAATA